MVGIFVKEQGYFEGGNTGENVEISWLRLEISEITENCRTKTLQLLNLIEQNFLWTQWNKDQILCSDT